MTLGINPESLTSLVPITVSDDEVSARAEAVWITKALRSTPDREQQRAAQYQKWMAA